MKKLLSFFGFLLIIGLASQASATTIDNASFENMESGSSTDFVTWTEAGTVSQVTDSKSNGYTASPSYAYETFTPTHGNYFAELSGDSSTITQNVSWIAGSTNNTFTFDWAFLLTGSDQIIEAYFQLGDRDEVILSTSVLIFEDINSGLYPWHHDYTGWNSYTYTFDSIGQDTFGDLVFGVRGSGKLLLDASPSAVPEPATLILFGLGLLGVAGLGRRKA